MYIIAHIGQKHREFVAPITGNVVRGANVGLADLDHAQEHPVSGLVAVPVVDLLKIVQIQEQERKWLLALLVPVAQPRHVAVKGLAVEGPGQGILPRFLLGPV